MRPALSLREFRPAVEQPETPAPIGPGVRTTIDVADASPELATQIARARRDARLHPAQAALLLRSWMCDHD